MKGISFIKIRKTCLIIAAVVIVAGLLCSTVIFGTDLSINFAGGTIISYNYTGDINDADVKALAETTFGSSVRVTKSSNVAGDTQVLTVELVQNAAVSNDNVSKFNDEMEKKYEANGIKVAQSNAVDPTVGKGFFIKCLFAAGLGAIFVTIYVGLRFRKIGGVSAAGFALLALLHDIIIAFCCYSVFGFDIDDNFIAVVLTLFGYSLNGTIVIYDRIRENKRMYGKSKTLEEVVDISVNQTFMRNLITSATTFVAVTVVSVVCYMRGITSIMSFTVPMAIGIVAGCFSSVFLASPLWAGYKTRKAAKQAAKQAK
ncbi:MAG: protein translocase subunit SecF [Clostridia bacterium]|nr:protein translocase subunit SecF [Clostridia bacterium]